MYREQLCLEIGVQVRRVRRGRKGNSIRLFIYRLHTPGKEASNGDERKHIGKMYVQQDDKPTHHQLERVVSQVDTRTVQ